MKFYNQALKILKKSKINTTKNGKDEVEILKGEKL